MSTDNFIMSPHCCRKLKSHPNKPCPWALARLRGEGSNICEWYINDGEAYYCFWYYLWINRREHTVTEIAHLWNTSVNNVSIAERSAYNKVIKTIIE